jgi:hypothetical protein
MVLYPFQAWLPSPDELKISLTRIASPKPSLESSFIAIV